MYQPLALRNHWMTRSWAFLELIRRERPRIAPVRLQAGIAFWCRGFPPWYRTWLLARLGLTDVGSQPSQLRKATEVATAFAKRLAANHRNGIFLLGDAAVLACAYEAYGGSGVSCRLSRSTLLSPTYSYLDLFDLVNVAALQTRTSDYASLYRNYRRRFDDYAKSQPATTELLEHVAMPLAAFGATAIADTGMQGTLAFALAATLERMTGNYRTVHLAVAYPWLSHLLNDTTQSDDANIALTLEQIREPHTDVAANHAHRSDTLWRPVTSQSAFRA